MIVISIAAQCTVDAGNIPITGQTLAILCSAFFLSPLESFCAISIYLIAGFVGFPVFADGESGIEKLIGGSGGYLAGFLVAATSVAYLHEKKKNSEFRYILLLTSLGTALILALGVGRLMTLYGFENGIAYGFTPFWKGALIKIFLGSAIVWFIKKYASANAS